MRLRSLSLFRRQGAKCGPWPLHRLFVQSSMPPRTFRCKDVSSAATRKTTTTARGGWCSACPHSFHRNPFDSELGDERNGLIHPKRCLWSLQPLKAFAQRPHSCSSPPHCTAPQARRHSPALQPSRDRRWGWGSVSTVYVWSMTVEDK